MNMKIDKKIGMRLRRIARRPFARNVAHPDEKDVVDHIETEDGDWLNSGITEASASDIRKKDDDWLNADTEDIPTNVNRQADDDWLNGRDNQSSESSGELSSNNATVWRPEIQIKQNGSVVDIRVTASEKQGGKSQKPVINLKIKLSPQSVARKGERPYDVEITEDSSSSSYQSRRNIKPGRSGGGPADAGPRLFDDIYLEPGENLDIESHALMDEISVKPPEGPVNVGPQALDEIRLKPAEKLVAESHPLMDEISVRPVEGPVNMGLQLLDEIQLRPPEKLVAESHPLMDEISVRPIEGPVKVSPQLLDEIQLRPAEKLAGESHALMDEIFVKPSPSPVIIEYELLDDLITKGGNYRTRISKPLVDVAVPEPAETIVDTVVAPPVEPLSDTAMPASVETPAEIAEPAPAISIEEIAEVLNDKKGVEPVVVPSFATKFRTSAAKALAIPRVYRPVVIPPFTAKLQRSAAKALAIPRVHGPVVVPPFAIKFQRSAAKALAKLWVYNHDKFYIKDTNLTHVDASTQEMAEPRIEGFAFKVLNTRAELDEMIGSRPDLTLNFRQIRRGLKRGMVAFLAAVDGELACLGWACVTEESKTVLSGYPYYNDLDVRACVVGDWTSPKFRDSGISNYVKYQRQKLLREKGFTFERSLAEESKVNCGGFSGPVEESESTYRRRTYTNVSLPGILGVQFWRERPLNGTATKRSFRMITLYLFALPSPPPPLV